MYGTWWVERYTWETITTFSVISISITSKSFLLPSYLLLLLLFFWYKNTVIGSILSANFKVSNIVNYKPYAILHISRTFILHNPNSYLLLIGTIFSLSIALTTSNSVSAFLSLSISDSSYKWYYVVFVLLCLDFFTWRNILQIHSCYHSGTISFFF